MRILVWHVHGGWMNSFVRGPHEYLLPTLPEGGPFGAGRLGRDWPESAREVDAAQLTASDVDVVVLQRIEELALAERWLGPRVPKIFVEHNTPKVERHPLADRDDVLIAHVTHFNALMWDCGSTPTTVIEHGVVDPGERYTGELARAGVVINEPVRRWRVTGTDLVPRFAEAAPLDVFGMGLDGLVEKLGCDRVTPVGDLPTERLHTELARRRAYVHTPRWTSLGLSLIEAMHLGMPVVALGTTEAARAVSTEAGFVSTDVDELVAAVELLMAEPELAARLGRGARKFALAHYGLDAFVENWGRLLDRVAG
ncbi:glycosyltransferase [Allokutzneria multivorans]|uniref:Glycosyltransferase n=1 Tax=Allokutzneria multivorans TaxID=1142134 RepID=A0ABP7TBJ4_9PSEU